MQIKQCKLPNMINQIIFYHWSSCYQVIKKYRVPKNHEIFNVYCDNQSRKHVVYSYVIFHIQLDCHCLQLVICYTKYLIYQTQGLTFLGLIHEEGLEGFTAPFLKWSHGHWQSFGCYCLILQVDVMIADSEPWSLVLIY